MVAVVLRNRNHRADQRGIIRKVNSGMGMVTSIDPEKGATVRAP